MDPAGHLLGQVHFQIESKFFEMLLGLTSLFLLKFWFPATNTVLGAMEGAQVIPINGYLSIISLMNHVHHIKHMESITAYLVQLRLCAKTVVPQVNVGLKKMRKSIQLKSMEMLKEKMTWCRKSMQMDLLLARYIQQLNWEWITLEAFSMTQIHTMTQIMWSQLLDGEKKIARSIGSSEIHGESKSTK